MSDRIQEHPGTIGHLEAQAGIGASHEERLSFWMQFAPLKAAALDAGIAELRRMASNRQVAA